MVEAAGALHHHHQDVARTAIAQDVSERPQRLRSAIGRVRAEDRELLERLAQ